MAYNISNDPFYSDLYFKRAFGYTFLENPYFHGFEFEKIGFTGWQEFMIENWKLAIYASVFYVITIFGLQRVMKNRPAFDLRKCLFVWNLAIGLASLVGFIRVFPAFLTVLSEQNGFYNSICVKKGLDIPSAYWAIVFACSKFLELGDTVFIVLRKRPLVFLQWYHHLVTLMVTWITAPLVEPIVRWYAVLNAFVHSFMYLYFALRAISVKIPSYVANFITTIQFSQMLVGFVVNMASWYLQHNGYGCVRYPLSINVFGFVYGTFILLFGKLFYDSVIKSGRKLKQKTKQG
ncbi:putative fatty acid elongation protein 3 [Orchesella cincta]|uniref:Elongation of very long chain fatty acids protein n=1 Tax=Orchesella cincta TaxID=48709 RepID=A0A1D2MWY9_ORCCI|nr:putative fatty acid elongation protein 3 [Orchesella cincta]